MKKQITFILTAVLMITGSAYGGFRYAVKADHAGGNVTPSQACEMVQKDPAHTFIVDTRTRAEYQLIGHPVGAINIPKAFWTEKLGEKGYTLVDNPDFSKDLLARFNPATDKLVFMCRSGKRSCLSCQAAIDAGWDTKNVCNMLGGFEGDKLKNANSVYDGKRILGGWKNEGLPWTYHIDKQLVYAADVTQ